MNQGSKISAERVKRVVQNRFNPIRNLTPEYLGRALDAFERGDLKAAAQLWETIERRDDKLKCVIPKRKKAVGRYGWNIVMDEEGERAEKHKQALEHFFKNSVATDAVRGNYCRGWSGLVRQMLDALGKGYAVHELIWKPSPDGLTAEFKFAPLWFFENRTGKLRFLPEEDSRDGEDLEDGEWMVTVEDGLMEASSIAYMFKILPLRDWLIFCEKFGIPPVIGKTNASQDSKEWETMVNAVGNFMNDWAAVISLNSEIEFPQVGGSGDRPFAPLVDRIDRVLASMWRGGDLSSMSATAQDAGQGASVQGDESDLLEEDDAETICETLNKQVVPWVIKYALGDDTPLARLDIPLPSRSDNNSELEVDKAFKDLGISQAVTDIRERYGRRTPDDKDEVIGGNPEGEKTKAKTPNSKEDELANIRADGDLTQEEIFERSARIMLDDARTEDLDALSKRLAELLQEPDFEKMKAGLADLDLDLPDELSTGTASEKAWEDFYASAFINGLASADDQDEELANGDKPGHPFRGNQWKDQHGGAGAWIRRKFKGLSRDPKTKPNSDQFGNLPAKGKALTPKQNELRAWRALSFVQTHQSDVARAVFRKEVGVIALPWGRTGTMAKNYEDGFGVAKIQLKHPQDVAMIPAVLSRGEFYEHDRYPGKKAYAVLGDNHLMALGRKNKRSAWVITNFEDPKTIKQIRKNQKKIQGG